MGVSKLEKDRFLKIQSFQKKNWKSSHSDPEQVIGKGDRVNIQKSFDLAEVILN